MSSNTNTNDHTPWVEKYRPKNLYEISHQTEIVSTLHNAVETNRLPHLLLYGPPGTGKTSVALALCRSLWSPEELSRGRRVLELNASDERGISVVRDKIKHFAGLAVGGVAGGNGKSNQALMKKKKMNFFQKKTGGDEEDDDGDNDDDDDVEMKDVSASASASGEQQDGDEKEQGQKQLKKQYPNPPFKVIILDEADTVTPDAQAALRRIIEAYSKVTRFILICNYVTRIIEPLASRCAKFRFQSLPPQSMMSRLQTISKEEKVCFVKTGKGRDMDISEEESKEKEIEVLNEILVLCNGDMRRAVTTLQSAHLLSGKSGYIQKESIAEMAGLPPQSIITNLLSILQNTKSTYDHMENTVKDIILEGYAAQQIMKGLLKELVALDSKVLSEVHKANIAIKIAEADKNLIDSADEMLQLLVVCSLILKCLHSKC